MSSDQPRPREAEELAEIDREADAARAAIPTHLRRKHHPRPAGSTRLTFSDRPATPDTRKA